MNYFSHYFVLPEHNDELLTLGCILPDLLRDVKIDIRALRMIENNSLAVGIIHHIDSDAQFHNSDFFKRFTKKISKAIREHPDISIEKYTYFLGHISLELFMDHLLIKANEELVDQFYLLLQQIDNKIVKNFFIDHLPNHDYELFQQKLNTFVQRKFLYDYIDKQTIGRVASMLFGKVNISTISVDNQELVVSLLDDLKDQIQAEFPQLIEELR